MAKNVIIGILSLLVVALVADSVWLHINCCRQQENIATLAHAGDFQFMDGKLVLNDKTPTAPNTEKFALTTDNVINYVFSTTTVDGERVTTATETNTTAMVLGNTFTRNTDYTIPIVIANNPVVNGLEYSYWRAVGYNGYDNCHVPNLYNAAYFLEKAIPFDTQKLESESSLRSAISAIINILSTLRITYMHVGEAGMVIGVDGTKSPAGIPRNAPDPPAQQNSP